MDKRHLFFLNSAPHSYYQMIKCLLLLLLPGSNISEVAEQAGFADLSYFSKAFKKSYGQAPQSYRKAHSASSG
ncbi:hypothetical protein BK132_34680 [Paenibacillus sp. FSL H8-0259]|nr:hypothetical protein BK132_34680 [Paenibacillus sp. FSL H8-0259]